jgi:hypothetical protein
MYKNPIETKKLVDEIFVEIEKAKTIDNLKEILKKFDDKYLMSEKKYPKIEFSIDKEELKNLSDFELEKDDTILLNSNIQDNILAKLLYALAWKNGDLVKLQHIIKGIKNVDEVLDDKNDGLVFYQFGKYLTKKNNEPIIDQHVLRAFAVYKETSIEKICNHQKMELINKSNKFLISEYKTWLSKLKNESGSVYYIDKILFALGKTIKNK